MHDVIAQHALPAGFGAAGASGGSSPQHRSKTFPCRLALSTLLLLAPFAAAQKLGDDAGVPGWRGFTSQLAALDATVLAHLPPRLRNDPQTVQEVGRVLLQAVATQTIAALGQDPDHPVFLPSLNFYLGGQPNSDTTYRTADIDPHGTYRLRGDLGSLRIFRLGLFGAPPADEHATMPTPAYYNFHTLTPRPNGRYDVLLSAQRPAGYTGDWWQLTSGTTQLFLRQVDYDWSKERDPTISIERVDTDVQRMRVPAAELRERLDGLGEKITRNVLFFIDHVEAVRQKGTVNRLAVWDVSRIGGLTGQTYYEGAYDVSDEDALVVEATVPAGCTYWSILLTNDLFETTDWYDNQSSLNGTQARVDADGVVRFVISAKDPGVPNWLATASYRSGLIQGRWAGCSTTPIPTVRRVPLSALRDTLPSATPAVSPVERQHTLRDRRLALQQRPLW